MRIDILNTDGEAIGTIIATPEFAEQQHPGAWRVSPDQADPPALAVTLKCSRRQGQLALLSYGLLDDAEAAIAAIADPIDRRAAQIEYDADTWERSNPFLLQLWTQIGGTPESLDAAFALAVTL